MQTYLRRVAALIVAVGMLVLTVSPAFATGNDNVRKRVSSRELTPCFLRRSRGQNIPHNADSWVHKEKKVGV